MNMSRLSSKRPVTPNKCDVEGDLHYDHWSKAVYENDLLVPNEGTLDFTIEGGSDNGEFPYFGIILEQSVIKNISNHDIILEIQGQKIAGYTQRDVIAWLNHCCRNGNPVVIKAVKAGHLTKDLRRYLNTRFQKGSVDHDLQNTIRDNLYLRTVPCTTRSPRDGEVNGVDYTFLTAEEFIALERSGNLLESGIYEGNHYGTPKPPKDSSVSSPRRSNSISMSSNIVPGAHASSEGKRRRNRSNVEAMAAKATDPFDSAEHPLLGLVPNTRSSTPVSVLSSHSGYRKCNNLAVSEGSYFTSCHSDLGPLPDHWEKAYTENGEPYFIDHNSGTSQWLDPRISRIQKKAVEECGDDELPFGWERIDDPHYGTYYIDHVNRRTQYENPVLQARRITQNASLAEFNNTSGSWHQKQDRRGSSGAIPHAANADTKESPHHSRNNSLTQIPNSSNSHGQIGTGNTNSESYLISSNSHLPNATSNPSSIPPSNNMSSSPASTHRFPYLHCIPCLNEKHEPNASPPKHGTDKKVEGIVGNGTINSNSATNVEDRENDSAALQSNINRTPSFTPVNNLSVINRPGNLGSRNEDISCRASSPLTASSLPGYISRPKPPYIFTHNPDELQGEFIQTPLIKSSRGFGFTIVGGDDEAAEEFLQIKNVVPNGPAWCDGKLQMGDVLVHVNNMCVLGYTHQDVVELFQSIPPGEVVNLEVCRGYPLPFDPNDPNTEIVTTVAVTMANARPSESQAVYSSSRYNANYVSAKVVSNSAVESVDSMSRTAKSMPDLSSKQSEHVHPLRHNSAGLLSPVAVEHTPNLNMGISKKPESLTVEIVKGTAGFGFTIADSAYGQKVKKILDRPRCKQLQEGDILIEINGHEVRGLPHAEVVQILKDCPCEDIARITVQRGGVFSPLKSKGKSKLRTSEDMNGFNKNNESEFMFRAPSFSPSPKRTDLSLSQTGGYRSKTPTADLYSSRDKESISIARPKTPLVDTRNWSRTSSADLVLEDNNSRLPHEVDKMTIINTEREYASSRPYEHSNIRTGMYGSSPERQGNPSWYSDHSRGRDWSNHNFRDPNRLQCYDSVQKDLYSYNNVSEETHQNSYQGHSKMPQSISHVLPREDGLVSRSLHSQDWRNTQTDSMESSAIQYTLMNNSNYSKEFGRAIYIPSQEYPVLHSHSNKVHSLSTPVYQLQPSSYYSSQLTGTNITSSLQQDSGACREIHSTSHNFPTSSVYSSSCSPRTATQLDSLHHKKHSTSFEHEHPVSSNMPHYSRDTRPVLNDNVFSNNTGISNQSNTTTECVDMTITLQRQESGFGFRIVGGTEEGSQVSVGHIVPGGAADVDGRLRSGDEIIGVDGQLVINTSHHHVVQLMGNAARSGKVILQLRRQIASRDHSFQSKSIDGIFPYDITVTRNENEGFGFVIISSVSRAGSTIGRIIESSPAERCGQLHVGDTILAVNGVNILNMHHGDIVNLIKDSGYSVNLTIGHPHDDVSSTASVSQKGEDISLEQDEHFHTVELHRGTRGFGFSIRGGKEFQNMPLFVLRIAENGPAYQDGRLQVGDQMIEINGVNTKNMTHAEAIELIRQGGSLVRLLVKRGSKLPSSLEQSSSLLQAFTPVSLSPLSSPVMNGPISQSSPRSTTQTEHTTQEIYNWSYEPH